MSKDRQKVEDSEEDRIFPNLFLIIRGGARSGVGFFYSRFSRRQGPHVILPSSAVKRKVLVGRSVDICSSHPHLEGGTAEIRFVVGSGRVWSI